MTEKDIKDMKLAMMEAIEEKLGEFYIERQKHFEHHQFIEGVMNTTEKIKGTACKTITTSSVVGLLTIIVLGFIAWIRNQLK